MVSTHFFHVKCCGVVLAFLGMNIYLLVENLYGVEALMAKECRRIRKIEYIYLLIFV
jgi:hypothetical protein